MATPQKPIQASPMPRPGGRAGKNLKNDDQTEAAIKIQSTSRMKKEQTHLRNKKKAALKIQTQARGKQERKHHANKKSAATKIQSKARQKLSKSKVQLRREEAARRKEEIAAENARLKQAKKSVVGKNDITLSRETHAMRDTLSEDAAAAKIQSRARGKMTRKETGKKIKVRRQSAVLIQKQARQKLSKSKVQLRREEAARRKEEIAAENARLKESNRTSKGRNDITLSDDVLARRKQLKDESDTAYQARLQQEQDTLQELADMKLNTQGRNDITLSDDVLARREQLKDESDTAYQARLQQEQDTLQELADMKQNTQGRNDITLSDETQEMRAILAET